MVAAILPAVVSLYEWLLFLHVASAFAFVASYSAYTVVLLAGRRADRADAALALLRVAGPANVLAWIGATGTVGFGLWLTLQVDGYELWDGWIVGTLGLWLVAEEAIRREDLVFRKAQRAARAALASPGGRADEARSVLRSRHAVILHLAAGIGLFAMLALMIFKPGAP